ncbi:MAG: carboxypeptidase regulatory-like domain-containing protein [Terriglobia bacterium]
MKRAVLLLGSILLLTAAVWCQQQETGTIVGTVVDSSGAVIPNAKITVSNPDKGINRVFTSGSSGSFSEASLPIGNYTVTAEAAGFEKLVRSGIALSVGQTQRVDLQLTVGQVTQEVSVTGNVVQVETENAAISGVISGSQVANLEINGRNFVNLALLVPGAVPDNGLNTSVVGVAGNNSISFNGGRLQYNNWEIDGGNNTDEGSASTFNTYPNLDSIAEFRISTSNYGADLGKHAGANIEVATKSGTKSFHGTASETNRNSATAANDFFLNRTNTPIAYLNNNEYGYTFGGPIWIPGHYNTDKSKTFFYWSEDWRAIRSANVVANGVPTAAMRQGDFSQCDPALNPGGNLLITDGCKLPVLSGVTGPAAGGGFDNITQMQTVLEGAPYNVGAPGLAQAFTNGVDLLNGEVPLQNTSLLGQWNVASSSPTNWREEQIRVDQNIGQNTRVFVRYTQDAWNTLSVPALWAWASYDTIKTPFGGPGKSAVIDITHSFAPNLMNEFTASYTTDHIILTNAFADSVAGNANRPSSFVMNHFFAPNDSNPLLPSLELCAGLNFCTNEDASNHPWKNSNPIIVWKDNLAWTHGNHTTKMGVYLENYRKNEQFGTDTQGELQGGGGGPSSLHGIPYETGNAMADMFLGVIPTYVEGSQAVNGVAVGGYPKGHWQMTDLEPYIQDDWKMTKKLTINLGLRYYSYTRIHDVSRPTIDSGFLPSLYSQAQEDPLLANGNINTAPGLSTYTAPGNGLVICGTGGIPKGCQHNDSGLNFAPRFGFAYDPWGTGKTVFRGGYGVYFESGNGNEAQTEGGEGNAPSAWAPSGSDIFGYNNVVPGQFGPTGYTAIPYYQGWPYVQQFNLNVQHQFGSNLLSVAYVGSLGRDLARDRNISEIPLGTTTVNNPSTITLAGAVGTKAANPGLNAPGDKGQTLCDASGNCNVPTALEFSEKPSYFFQAFTDYNNIQMKQNTAVSNYNALQVSLNHTFSHGLTFQAAYTWSHSIDNSTSTYLETSGSIDDQQLSRWKGTSDLNRAQVLQLNYIYAIPLFKNGSGLTKSLLGGWQISGISSFFTGEPMDFNCGVSGYSSAIGGAVRCDTIGPVKVDKTIANEPGYGPTLKWWNPSNIAQPQFSELASTGEACMFGCMGRNSLTGPGRNNTDLGLQKNFELPWFAGEHSTIQFRWDAFNAFNHTQYQYASGGCNGNTPFGVQCGSGNGNDSNGFVTSDWGPRVMQFGLKFIF